ncbi:hypothetical protein [uncultured Gimesia sp.]|uniref:hypothetical protein n=1 Tax=uncultured Gimesia sp. TaxID=1678688 RepID=UPI00263981FB|nr:hypothetical protein [uncultured Gimesia sp.]
MNIVRGLIAGLIGAVLGVVVPVVVIGLYTILYWYFNETSDLVRRDDITSWKRDAVDPLVGCAIYVGLAAWATYTPRREFRFSKTLVILFFTSMLLIILLNSMRQTPDTYRHSTAEDLRMSLPEFLMLLLPPLLVSCVMVINRCWKTGAVVDHGESDGDSVEILK